MKNPGQVTVDSSWSKTEIAVLRLLGTIAFTFLTVLSAQLRIPLPFTPVPMTLQTFIVPLAGGFLGTLCGTASIGLYMILGLIGMPVFAAATGGLGFFYGPTVGFLFGLVLAPAVVGWARDSRKGNLGLLIALIIAHFVIYLCGLTGFVWNTGASWSEGFAKAVAPFLPGDLLKITASYLVLLSYNHFRKIARW